MGKLIPIKEYAERHKKNPANIRQKIIRGGLKTAIKIGRDWMIDEDEPYQDRRKKNG